MTKIDIAKAAFEFDNPDRDSYLADDFQYTDALGSPPMDKGQWTAMDGIMRSAFPDISYAIQDIREEGDGVAVTGRWTGTFTSDLDLSAMGMGVIPATGKALALADETIQVHFAGDKISKVHDPNTGPEAGMPGFLRAIGVEMG